MLACGVGRRVQRVDVLCACVDVCACRGTIRHVAAARTSCESQLVAIKRCNLVARNSNASGLYLVSAWTISLIKFKKMK